jgi:16S rRNA (guanine527-N7)-methyltransferase
LGTALFIREAGDYNPTGSMTSALIAELLQPFLSNIPGGTWSGCGEVLRGKAAALSSTQLGCVSTYIDMLLRWNSRVNLTAIRDEEEIVTRHFGESFFAARFLFPAGAGKGLADSPAEKRPPIRVADLGSGAGFPGLPIKLWDEGVSLTLIESNQKKATFLREVVRALGLTGVKVENKRAEDLAPDHTYDVVTLRAVEDFASTLGIAVRLVAPGGRVALLIGSSQVEKARSAVPNFSWKPPIPIPQSQSRVLLVGYREPNEYTSGVSAE